MKYRLIFLLLVFLAPTLGQEIRMVEMLPDNSLIITVDGQEYRAFNQEAVEQIRKTKKDLEVSRDYIVNLQSSIKVLREINNDFLTNQETAIKIAVAKEMANTRFWQSEYGKEKVLRELYERRTRKCLSIFFGTKLCWF